MSDEFMMAAIAEAEAGAREGGIPIGPVNQTFMGEEDLLRSRGIALEVRQDPACIELMRRFIRDYPELCNDDIGRWKLVTPLHPI